MMYDPAIANDTCSTDTDFDSAFVQAMLASDASIFLSDYDFDDLD